MPRTVVLIFGCLLSGCGGIAHRQSPDLTLEIPASAISTKGSVVVFKPYDRSHLLSKEALRIVRGTESHIERRSLNYSGTDKLSIDLPGHMRAGVFWIVPPLGSAFLDDGAYALVMQPDRSLFGLAAEGERLDLYLLGADGALYLDSSSANNRFDLVVLDKTKYKIVWRIPENESR